PDRPDQPRQQLAGRGIDPMHILENDDKGMLRGNAAQLLGDDLGSLFWQIARGWASLGVRILDPQQGGQYLDRAVARQPPGGDQPLQPFPLLVGRMAALDSACLLDLFGNGVIGSVLPPRGALVALDRKATIGPDLVDQLAHQPGLADAGFALDADNL